MSRRVIAVLFVVLLLGMQQAAQWHALGHLGGWAHSGHDAAFSAPQSADACTLCALFAAGSPVAPDSPPPHLSLVSGFIEPGHSHPALTAASPSYYQSRAPPSRS